MSEPQYPTVPNPDYPHDNEPERIPEQLAELKKAIRKLSAEKIEALAADSRNALGKYNKAKSLCRSGQFSDAHAEAVAAASAFNRWVEDQQHSKGLAPL